MAVVDQQVHDLAGAPLAQSTVVAHRYSFRDGAVDSALVRLGRRRGLPWTSVAAIDAVVRALVERRLDEPVLAMARFQVVGADSRFDTSGVQLFSVGGWLVRRRKAGWPAPAYVVVCESTISVFSAKFGPSTRLVGPLIVWRRKALAAKSRDDGARVVVLPAPNKAALELEAVEPGPASDAVIRHLCELAGDDPQ